MSPREETSPGGRTLASFLLRIVADGDATAIVLQNLKTGEQQRFDDWSATIAFLAGQVRHGTLR